MLFADLPVEGDGPVLLLAIGLSLAATLAAAALAFLLASCLARERRPERGVRGVLRAAVWFPRTSPGILLALLALLGRAGAVPGLRDLSAGRGSLFAWIVLAFLYFEVPRVALILETAFRRLPRDLDDAARTLGASSLERLFWVTVPLSASALRSTLLATFAGSLGTAGLMLMLSPWGSAGVLCLLLALLVLGISSQRRQPA